MKKLAVLCLATLVSLCSCTVNGQKEFEKAKEFEKKRLFIEAASLYKKAAEKGHAKAQYELGLCYYDGCGVEQDRDTSEYWWKKAAKQGHVGAKRELGYWYSRGSNYELATYWWKQAAAQGDAEAQASLGACYYYGRGVNKDLEKAIYWWKKAAAQGDEFAIGSLERLEEESLNED